MVLIENCCKDDKSLCMRAVPGTESVLNKYQLLLLPLDLFLIRNTPFISWLLNFTAKSHTGSTREGGRQEDLGEGSRTSIRGLWGRWSFSFLPFSLETLVEGILCLEHENER